MMRITMMFFSILVVVAAAGEVARADVSGFEASVSSSIVQFSNGVEQQRDDRSSSYSSSGSVPVEVNHSLVGRVGGASTGDVSWTAFNRVIANDPQYNSAVPRDFIMETAVGSADTNTTLKVKSQAKQTRHINLLSSEFSGLATGTPVNLVSAFTLEGALAAIVPPSASTAEGLQIKCNIKVLKNDSPVFDGTVDMVGRADKTFAATTTGDIVDTDFVLAQNDIPDLARIGLLVFGGQGLPYAYSGLVGDSFDLTAVMDLEYTVPGGLGAGCAFGTVPSEMITLTQELFGDQADPIINPAAGETIITPTPEPASLALLVLGCILARKRR